jgi:hypothetical protein
MKIDIPFQIFGLSTSFNWVKVLSWQIINDNILTLGMSLYSKHAYTEWWFFYDFDKNIPPNFIFEMIYTVFFL